MDDKLLPIDKIISMATKLGARFGKGDAKIHLAYLTKLRILPQTIRRKIEGKIVGCYPQSIIPTILRAEELKDSGLSYSQIRYQLAVANPVSVTSPVTPVPVTPAPSFSLAFLIIGLLLGYLLAINNGSRPAQLASTPISPLDETLKTVVTMVGQEGREKEPIYIVSSPGQNFYRIGTVSINDLVKN